MTNGAFEDITHAGHVFPATAQAFTAQALVTQDQIEFADAFRIVRAQVKATSVIVEEITRQFLRSMEIQGLVVRGAGHPRSWKAT